MVENKRIEYVDAMRGFTMIMVVADHVAAFCLGIGDYVPSIHPIYMEFTMPLFFFISGFVFYKEGVVWNANHIVRLLLIRKFPALIITTFFFFLVFIKVNDVRFIEGLYSDSKLGYWFTIALFAYFCIYAICRYVLRMLNCKETFTEIMLLSIGLLLFALTDLPSSLEWMLH